MLSTSPAASSPQTRPSRLRRLSNLRSALHPSEPSPSRSSRPLFHRSGSTPEPSLRNRVARDSAPSSPGVELPGFNLSTTALGNDGTSDTPGTATTEGITQSSPSAQPALTGRRRSQTTSSIGSLPGASTPTVIPATAGPAVAIEMTRAATDQGTSSASMSTSVPTSSPVTARPGLSRKDTASLPSIRFVPFQDTRSSRPSLNFQTVSRILPKNESIIRVGRYSEKDNPSTNAAEAHQPDGPSDAAVGFKSKVVSRRHCEFFWKDSSWWIKDVKSSSGTFLNHIRLSQPGQESKPFRVKDGDIVQLGIDFKGGEEAIFRCVKIRILCNRGWQRELNSFNTSAHKQLRKLAGGGTAATTEAQPGQATECTICLSSIAPCQSLFIAPCSHTWHYKCIRPIIQSEYPTFLCPNCRAVADLEEDIEEPEQWGESGEDEAADATAATTAATAGETTRSVSAADATGSEINGDTTEEVSAPGELELGDAPQHIPSRPSIVPEVEEDEDDDDAPTSANMTSHIANLSIHDPSASSSPIAIPSRNSTTSRDHAATASMEDVGLHPVGTNEEAANDEPLLRMPARTLTSQLLEAEGPMTPRNNAGPFVFDGAAAGR